MGEEGKSVWGLGHLLYMAIPTSSPTTRDEREVRGRPVGRGKRGQGEGHLLYMAIPTSSPTSSNSASLSRESELNHRRRDSGTTLRTGRKSGEGVRGGGAGQKETHPQTHALIGARQGLDRG